MPIERFAYPIALHNGTYTVTREDGRHFVVKLYTAKGDLAGKRILTIRREGKDTGVAFWDDVDRRAFVWKRWQSPAKPRVDSVRWNDLASPVEKMLAQFLNLALEPGGFWTQEGFRMEAATRCVLCNGELTHPKSIADGIGPVCAKKV
jgi:hypothetical protein